MRSVTQRRSMIPSSRSRSPGSTPQRSRPSWASGSSRRSTSSAAGTSPRPGPVDARVDAVARAGVEVLLGGARTTSATTPGARPRRARGQAVVEGGVGERCRRRSGRPAARGSPRAGAGCRRRRRRSAGSSGRSVPLCSRSSPSCGHVAALERLQRVLVVADRQQRREVADVLLEQVEDRRDPALAEPHARAHALRLELLGPRVGRLLEQRDARLAPQLLAEEERRVRADRDLDARRSPAPRSSSAANASGSTCWCSWTLVHAASGAIVSA